VAIFKKEKKSIHNPHLIFFPKLCQILEAAKVNLKNLGGPDNTYNLVLTQTAIFLSPSAPILKTFPRFR